MGTKPTNDTLKIKGAIRRMKGHVNFATLFLKSVTTKDTTQSTINNKEIDVIIGSHTPTNPIPNGRVSVSKTAENIRRMKCL